MRLNNIKSQVLNRLPGGVYYEWIKRIRKYREKDDLLLKEFEQFYWSKYLRGSNCYTGPSMKKGNFIDIYGVKIPYLESKDWISFWSEFSDLILPFKIENEGNKYSFDLIEDFLDEGPYELNDNVCIEKGDVVFDCGANIGLFSAICSIKGSKVYAFEPSTYIIERYLNKTAEWNSNIDIFPYALGKRKGYVLFETNLDSISSSKISDSLSNNNEKIEMISIDTFVKENRIEKVNFIKSDIEGAERNMLMGATKVLRDMGPKLSICTYHLPDDKQVLEDIVLKANPKYKIEHRYKKMYAYIPKAKGGR